MTLLVAAVTFPVATVVADLVVGVGPMVVVVVAKNTFLVGMLAVGIVLVDLVVGVGPMVVVVVAKNPAAGLEHAIVVAIVAVVGVHIVNKPIDSTGHTMHVVDGSC